MVVDQPILEDARLVGVRVILRPQRSWDAVALFPLVYKQSAVTDMLVWNGPEDLAELEELYSAWRLGGAGVARDYFFVILDASTGKPIGNCGLRFIETAAAGFPRLGNVGYWLGETYWGGGRMTEAVALLTWLAFEKLGAESLEALCLEVNVGSQRVLEKCGFRIDPSYDGEAQHHGPLGLDCELRYELSRSDYESCAHPSLPVDAMIELA